MKKRNIIIAMTSLILVSMMVLFSCEKRNILLPADNPEATLELPSEVAAYLSDSEISAFYQEIDAVNKGIPPHYMVRLVGIVMENEVEYLYEKALPPPQSPTQIKFTGSGNWKGLGKIRYAETVDLRGDKTEPGGKGAIFLINPLEDRIAPIEAQLRFESSQREECRNETDYPNASPDIDKGKEQRFHSRIDFTGGDDIFDGAYGKAHKLEIHDLARPDFCKGVIYGHVITRVK